MAKLEPKIIKIMAESSTASTIPFGDKDLDNSNVSKDPDVLQPDAIFLGWADSVFAGNTPAENHFNTLQYLVTRKLKEFQQQGIPEYITGEEYYLYSVVKKPNTVELYESLKNDNTEALPDQVSNVNWRFLGDLRNLNSTKDYFEGYVNGGRISNSTTAVTDPDYELKITAINCRDNTNIQNINLIQQTVLINQDSDWASGTKPTDLTSYTAYIWASFESGKFLIDDVNGSNITGYKFLCGYAKTTSLGVLEQPTYSYCTSEGMIYNLSSETLSQGYKGDL